MFTKYIGIYYVVNIYSVSRKYYFKPPAGEFLGQTGNSSHKRDLKESGWIVFYVPHSLEMAEKPSWHVFLLYPTPPRRTVGSANNTTTSNLVTCYNK